MSDRKELSVDEFEIEIEELAIDEFGNIEGDAPAEKAEFVKVRFPPDVDLELVMRLVSRSPKLRKAYEFGLRAHTINASPYCPYSDEFFAAAAGFIMPDKSAELLKQYDNE